MSQEKWTPETVKTFREKRGLNQHALGVLMGYVGQRSTTMAHSEQRLPDGTPRRSLTIADRVRLDYLQQLPLPELYALLRDNDADPKDNAKWVQISIWEYEFRERGEVKAECCPIMQDDGSLMWGVRVLPMTFPFEEIRLYRILRSAKCSVQGTAEETSDHPVCL